MKEGWSGNQYLILFSGEESEDRTRQYRLAEYLPGYRVVGLGGWDDFLLMHQSGTLFSVPTVPLVKQHLEPFVLPDSPKLIADERWIGKVKWYIQPVVFGGDPDRMDNIVWVSHEKHIELVNWWNQRYREVASRNSGA